ncbi:MAG: hypothetical protein CK427_09660 [Leptospira sp.]|nr:MAG: hypothetical protein CK427_09660 [Leptospira sp.]
MPFFIIKIPTFFDLPKGFQDAPTGSAFFQKKAETSRRANELCPFTTTILTIYQDKNQRNRIFFYVSLFFSNLILP